jgi:hypothetical protein
MSSSTFNAQDASALSDMRSLLETKWGLL